MLVEVCANSLESALIAEKAGADRIELCSELAVGGITPSYGLLKAVSEKIAIPVRVLIRPRSGDFTYSDDEFEIMKTNVALCGKLGFEGIATGLLHTDLTINENRLSGLVEINHSLKITFHRAFDWVPDMLKGLEKLERMGVDTLLTSGQRRKAIQGIDILHELHEKASSCTIMPGSGINVSNAHLFKQKGFKAIHLSAAKMKRMLYEDIKVPMNSPKLLSDDSIPLSSSEIIQEVIRVVK